MLSFSRLGRDFLYAYFYFHVPVAGSYALLDSHLCDFRILDSSGNLTSGSLENSSGTFTHFNADGLLSFSSRTIEAPFRSSNYSSLSVYFPVYEVIPDSAIDISSGGQYNITTRPTTITGGNYGIVGDNGQITTITDNSTIVNETNNTYYNPATGSTTPIVDWSYDYGDRTYNVTLEGGDTVQVTYGDENITIQEGDTNYIILYMVNGTGGNNPNPGPTACVHSWRESSRIEPGCTSPGRVVYTCSSCGQTKSETLKALGHTWQVERTVNTTYDENGSVIQQGYTIYQCSVCGEQYKDTDSTGPPQGSDFDDGGLGEFLDDLAKNLLNGLSSAVDLILGFFQAIPRLFGGFLDFLSAMFPYLPDDVVMLFSFGMAAVVFIGILRWLRR